MESIIVLIIIAIGSFCQSSSYVPIKTVTEWSWESFWLLQGVFALLVFPLVGALLGIPQGSSLFDLWGTGGAPMSIFYGILWGVGGLTFGLSMRYLGVALGQSIALGTCAGFGTLFPAIFAGTNLFEGNGLILLLGVCITLSGIAIIGYAGSLRAKNMSEEEKRAAVKDFALTKGLLVALLAGVMSACFALGLDAGTPIKEAALAGGVEGLYAGLPVIFLVTLGGFLTNAVYCLQQNIANKTMSDYAKSNVWGLKSMGLYQTQEELDNAPKPIGTKPRLGDIRYMDINGDGQINSQDQVKIARNSRPELMFALMADANYKGFDLSIQLQGAALCDKMLQQNWYNLNGVTDQTPLTKPFYAGVDNAPLYLVENSWRPDNINAEYPRLSISPGTNNAQISDYWKRNGAYLRLKNVVLGYTFPKQWMNKLGVGSLRIYASGQNLLTFTEFKYLDPESANVITGYYPQQRTFSVGVDVSF